eukprot:c24988_g1_i3 orf=729-2108(+)
MGSGDTGTPTKTTKTSTAQEQAPASAPMSYPEWAAAFQAYYSSGATPLPPPGYFPSSVASGPQPHPYVWGAQPLMPPYGSPSPYAAIYPHGAMYAHPSMPPGTHPYSPYSLAPGSASEPLMAVSAAGTDAEGRLGEGKDRSPLNRSKGSLGSLGMLVGKGSEAGKGTCGSFNGAISQSCDSGSEGSSEGSDGNSQNSSGGQKSNMEQATSEAALPQSINSMSYVSLPYGSHEVHSQAGNQPVPAIPFAVAGRPATAAGPTTNLNIGMDYWSGAPPGTIGTVRGKRSSAATTTTAMIPSTSMLCPGRDNATPELWLQDERELKRQRRKQSNRESARRSRLRKQAECEELAAKVETLTVENVTLRAELNRLSEQCKKLSTENSSLMEQLHHSQEDVGTRSEETDKEGVKSTKPEIGSDSDGAEANNVSLRDTRVGNIRIDRAAKSYLKHDSGSHAVSVSLG